MFRWFHVNPLTPGVWFPRWSGSPGVLSGLTWVSAGAPPVLPQSEALGLQEEPLQHHHLRRGAVLLWDPQWGEQKVSLD